MNVVMLAKNRVNLTNQAVESLYLNTNWPVNFTLVDDGSVIPHHCTLWKGDNKAILRNQTSTGITAQVRNLGVYWSEAYFGRDKDGLLYLSDNDAYFTSGWALKMVKAFEMAEKEGFALLGGQNHPYHQPIGESVGGQVKEYLALAGTSWLMRWDTWDKYGPLVLGAPGVCQSEDHLFCVKLREDGHKVGAIWPHVV